MDEKSQIQALDGTQPGLLLKMVKAETQTHDYKRNGTTTLFAALNTLDGKVIGQCYQRHRHQEFLKFLRTIERQTSKKLELHLILDNHATHKHQDIKDWMAKHPRIKFHFVPTSSSWLNIVEWWFSQITEKRIRRGVFPSVSALVTTTEEYVKCHNLNPKPFVWTASVETILEKIKHANEVLDTPQ
jgi:transposase